MGRLNFVIIATAIYVLEATSAPFVESLASYTNRLLPRTGRGNGGNRPSEPKYAEEYSSDDDHMHVDYTRSSQATIKSAKQLPGYPKSPYDDLTAGMSNVDLNTGDEDTVINKHHMREANMDQANLVETQMNN